MQPCKAPPMLIEVAAAYPRLQRWDGLLREGLHVRCRNVLFRCRISYTTAMVQLLQPTSKQPCVPPFANEL